MIRPMIARSCAAAILAMGSPWHTGRQRAGQAPMTDGIEIRVSADTIPVMRSVLAGDRLRAAKCHGRRSDSNRVGGRRRRRRGGPQWLDTDRFDVIAGAPVGSGPKRRQRCCGNCCATDSGSSATAAPRQSPHMSSRSQAARIFAGNASGYRAVT